MHKPFRHIAFAAFLAISVVGQSMTALAGYKDDVNNGPGATNQITQESPDGNASGAAPQGAGETLQTVEISDGAQAAENAETAAETQVPVNQAYLQIQLLRPDLTWTDPIVDDTVVSPGEGGFLSPGVNLK